MWWYILVLVLLCAAIVVYLFQKRRGTRPSDASYVCEICGEKDCICHEEKRD